MTDQPLDPRSLADTRLLDRIWDWAGQAVAPIDAAAIARGVTTSARRRPFGMSGRALRLAGVLGVVAVTTGAVLVVGSLRPSPSTLLPSTPAVRSILPDELPADVLSGTLDTPIGPMRWVHLTGDRSTVAPPPAIPMPYPDGLLWFQGGSSGSCDGPGVAVCRERPRLWASTDALTNRTELALPLDVAGADHATLTELDGTWWLVASGPTSIWRSTDLERWEGLDLGALVSPGPAQLEWDAHLGTPAAADGVTVVPVTYVARDPGRLLGRRDLAFPVPAESGGYRIMRIRQEPPQDVGEVHILETERGLRFDDPAEGIIAELDGVGIEFVEAWSANHAVLEHHVGLVDGAALIPAALPGPRLADPHRWHAGPTFFGTSTGLHAYHGGPNGTLRSWASADGRAWTERDPIGDDVGEPRDVSSTGVQPGWGRPSVLTAWSVTPEGLWWSQDGASWTQGTSDPVTGEPAGFPWVVRGGWLMWPCCAGRLWASRDGTAWELVEGLSLRPDELALRPNDGVVAVIGDTLFISRESDDWTRSEWLIVEPQPD